MNVRAVQRTESLPPDIIIGTPLRLVGALSPPSVGSVPLGGLPVDDAYQGGLGGVGELGVVEEADRKVFAVLHPLDDCGGELGVEGVGEVGGDRSFSVSMTSDSSTSSSWEACS